MKSRRFVVVRHANEGHAISWLGSPILYKAIQPETSGFFAWSMGRIRPGQGPSPHIQTREEEGFYVASGELTFQAGSQTCTLKHGDFINVGIGTPHRFVNTGGQYAEVIVVNAPAGFDAFQIAAGDPLRWIEDPCHAATHADHARIRQLAPRFGIVMDEEPNWFKRTPKVHLCRASEGATYSVMGDRYRFLVTGEETQGQYALIEAFVPPGGGPPLHSHTREHEAFFVQSGELTFEADDKEIKAHAGTFLSIPPESPHRFQNRSDHPATMLMLVAPAGLEKLFTSVGLLLPDATSMPLPPSQSEIERVLATAPRFGVKILPH